MFAGHICFALQSICHISTVISRRTKKRSFIVVLTPQMAPMCELHSSTYESCLIKIGAENNVGLPSVCKIVACSELERRRELVCPVRLAGDCRTGRTIRPAARRGDGDGGYQFSRRAGTDHGAAHGHAADLAAQSVLHRKQYAPIVEF